jgi:hypothetical protein
MPLFAGGWRCEDRAREQEGAAKANEVLHESLVVNISFSHSEFS